MAKRPAKIIRNTEGLTLNEWMAAVGAVPMMDLAKLRLCWERGEDPAEWRKHYADLAQQTFRRPL